MVLTTVTEPSLLLGDALGDHAVLQPWLGHSICEAKPGPAELKVAQPDSVIPTRPRDNQSLGAPPRLGDTAGDPGAGRVIPLATTIVAEPGVVKRVAIYLLAQPSLVTPKVMPHVTEPGSVIPIVREAGLSAARR